MKPRVIAALAILALVIIVGIGSLAYTNALYGSILDLLELAKPGGQSGQDALREAYELWRGNQAVICILVGDTHVDTVTFAFARALSQAREGGDRSEYITAVADLISGITHLRDFDRPTLQAIL